MESPRESLNSVDLGEAQSALRTIIHAELDAARQSLQQQIKCSNYLKIISSVCLLIMWIIIIISIYS